MGSRQRDETLPAIDIQDGDSTSEFLPAPTPTSNPAEDSRIARPADDDFDARTRASVAPMFEQLLNRLDAMETRMTARSTRSSPERGPPPSPRHSEFTYADDRRRHDDDEAGIQRALKQLKDGIGYKANDIEAHQLLSLEGSYDGGRASHWRPRVSRLSCCCLPVESSISLSVSLFSNSSLVKRISNSPKSRSCHSTSDIYSMYIRPSDFNGNSV